VIGDLKVKGVRTNDSKDIATSIDFVVSECTPNACTHANVHAQPLHPQTCPHTRTRMRIYAYLHTYQVAAR